MLWDDVVEVLDRLDRGGVRHWVAGGWGIDALVGSMTRRHRDLDLAVDDKDFDACMTVLVDLGYSIETDGLPLRVEVAATGKRWVDVHPVRFDAQGNGLQGDSGGTHFHYPSTAFVVGLLGGRSVHCLSAEQQAIFHSGYELRPQDEHDLRLLNEVRGQTKPRILARRRDPWGRWGRVKSFALAAVERPDLPQSR